jgi:hypothetical protein
MTQEHRQERHTRKDRGVRLSRSVRTKQILRWQPSRRQVLWTIGIGSLLAAPVTFVYLGYSLRWTWTGPPQKDLFDWIQVLVIPSAVAVGTFVLNRAAKRRDDATQKQQKAREEAIQQQHAQDAALEAYLERMTQLLLKEQLLTSESGSVGDAAAGDLRELLSYLVQRDRLGSGHVVGALVVTVA